MCSTEEGIDLHLRHGEPGRLRLQYKLGEALRAAGLSEWAVVRGPRDIVS